MRTLASVSVLVLGMGLAAACGAESASDDMGEDAAELGEVSLALMTTGPDGANYILPWSARLSISRTGESTPATTLQLGEPAPTLTIAIEADDYVGTIDQLANQFGEVFLYREVKTGWEAVSAELISANPAPFTVTPGKTTTLPIRFRLATIGDVVFDVGTLDVKLDLENSSTPGQSRGFQGIGTCTLTESYGYPAANAPVLSGLRNLAVGSSSTLFYQVDRTGDWVLSPEDICAPVIAREVGIESPRVMALLFNEARGATGSICFRNADGGGNVALWLERTGSPIHPDLRAELPAITTSTFSLSGQPPHPLVVNGKLSLSELREPITLSEVYSHASISDPDNAGSYPGRAVLGGTVTIQANL